MLTRHMLGVEEAQRAIDATIKEAEKDKQPMSIAVTDSYGELIACYRMDDSPPRVLRHAIRKASPAPRDGLAGVEPSLHLGEVVAPSAEAIGRCLDRQASAHLQLYPASRAAQVRRELLLRQQGWPSCGQPINARAHAGFRVGFLTLMGY